MEHLVARLRALRSRTFPSSFLHRSRSKVPKISYQVLQSQIQYESQQSLVKYLEELLRLTDRRFSQRAALDADRLNVKVDVAKATYQRTTLKTHLRLGGSQRTDRVFRGARPRRSARTRESSCSPRECTRASSGNEDCGKISASRYDSI